MHLEAGRGARFLLPLAGIFWFAACVDSSMLSGKLCDQEGRCLPGYVCDPATNRCVPEGQLPDGDGDEDGNRDEDGGLPDGDFGWPDGGEVPEGDRLPDFLLDPSNLDGPILSLMCGSGQVLSVAGNAEINTDTGVITGPGGELQPEEFQIVEQPGEYWPDLAVFTFYRVEIAAGSRLKASGDKALVILACRDIRIAGVLDVRGATGVMTGDAVGTPGRGGPGGHAGGEENGGAGLGFGGGRGGGEAGCNPQRDSGGAGGGFGAAGGAGGSGGDPEGCGIQGPSGGSSYGGSLLVPLVGGSGGGGGGDMYGGPGGGGGGAVQLGANLEVRVESSGGVLAGGGGGAGGHDGRDSSAGGGGGSGGAILLEGQAVTVKGVLAANGGGGGAGYPDNLAFDDRVADDGSPGSLGVTRAPGGSGSGLGGSGGTGSGGTGYPGEAGWDNENGGGGGGGAGRIRINTQTGSADIDAGAVLSPSGAANGCEGLCSQGVAESL